MTRPCALLLIAWAAMLTACGGSEAPTYQLTQSQGEIRAAEEVGAGEVPQAALHLKMAKDYLRRAQTLIDDEEYDRARWALQRAESDAELAIALAREAEQHAEAQKAKRELERLRERVE